MADNITKQRIGVHNIRAILEDLVDFTVDPPRLRVDSTATLVTPPGGLNVEIRREDEIVHVTGVTDSDFSKTEAIAADIVQIVVFNEATDGLQVSFDSGSTFVQMLRAIKSGSEFNFLDIRVFDVDNISSVAFKVLANGTQDIKIIKKKA